MELSRKVINNEKKLIRKKQIGDYYIGLDIGTSSVGWAVTDTKYNILNANSRKMWGSRLFKEADTAQERRRYRTNRRRIKRRKERLDLLQEIFSEEIYKVDKTFFLRLEESKFFEEDKDSRISSKYLIFAEHNKTDKDFYEEYPTIYHLRQELIEGKEDVDIRELYLAVHHIIKYRGHFLIKGDIGDTSNSVSSQVEKIIEKINLFEIEKNIEVNKSIVENITGILVNNQLTNTDKKTQLKKILPSKSPFIPAFCLSVGAKENIKNIFVDNEFDGYDENELKIKFSEKDYDDVKEGLINILYDDIDLIDDIKLLYDTLLLNKIMPAGIGLSESKVMSYNQHRSELGEFKKFIKEYTDSENKLYYKIFREDKKDGCNYVNYIKKSRNGKSCTREEFYEYVTKLIKDIPGSEKYITKIKQEEFLPLQRNKENGVIPYQIHKKELIKILDNASEQFEFLNKEENGISNKDKIISLLEFKIPYYVGPLNKNENSKYAWVVRKNKGKVTPWNFEEMVDVGASAENFILRMTNNCKYLNDEKVIPKNSLLYSEFTLLNELNNLRYGGEKLSIEIKHKMIEDIFKDKHRKMTVKAIKEYLISENYCDGTLEITGIDIYIKSDLKSYRDMHDILKDKFEYGMAEEIIKWITLFNGEEKLIKEKINENYKGILTNKQIDRIVKLRYEDWGNFSSKFLTEVYSDSIVIDGKSANIITALKYTDMNLNEILYYNRGELINKIKELNRVDVDENKFEYNMLENLYMSAPVKRSLWESLKIVDEIREIMGYDPAKIFVEVTRTNRAKSVRTTARKDKLIKLYENIKEESVNWTDKIQSVEGKLMSKKYYLYFMQKGKCAYSGENIDLDNLNTSNYDIDHIYPRSKIKDDSFDNLVLVKTELNRDKSDNPISKEIVDKMKSEWTIWHKQGFISSKKYERLCRYEPFTDEEMSGFIARQLVETSQSSLSVAHVLENIYTDTKIVYVKAENVSDFRHLNKDRNGDEIKERYIKIRKLNDLHHAKDAYLNIVVGNVYNEKFTKYSADYIKNMAKKDMVKNKDGSLSKYNLNRVFEFKVNNNGKEIWNPNYFNIIDKYMKSNDINVTKKPEDGKGKLFEETIAKAKDIKENGNYHSLKTNDKRFNNKKSYGAYNSLFIAYHCVVSYRNVGGKKAKNEYRIVSIPICVIEKSKDSLAAIKDYAEKEVDSYTKGKYEDFKIIIKKLSPNTPIIIDGFEYYVGRKHDATRIRIKSAAQIIIDNKDIEKYFKEVVKFSERDYKYNYSLTKEKNLILFEYLVNKKVSRYFTKMINNQTEKFIEEIKASKFNDMDVEEQAKVIMGIFGTLIDESINKSDLKKIGVNYNFAHYINMNLSKYDSVKVINQSITGIFENVITIK